MSKRNITRKNKPEVRYLLPIEFVALYGAVAATLLTFAFPVAFYFPDTHSSAFALEHYLLGIALAASLLIAIQWHAQGKLDGPEIACLVREIFALGLVVFLHFNLKLWAQLINPHRFDSLYFAIDQSLAPLLQGIEIANLAFTPLKTALPDAYHDIFVAMFLATFILFAATNRREAFQKSLLAITFVLLIGGLTYIPFPANGPFIFHSDSGEHAHAIQQEMLGFMERFLESNGAAYTGGNFIMPLAAMPSLHVAHAFVLLYYAWKHLRWLGHIYLPLFIFLATEAVSSRWHYLVDLPVGLLIAALCIKLARSIPSRRE